MNVMQVRWALALAVCLSTGMPMRSASGQDARPDPGAVALWVALPYPADEATYGRALKAAWDFAQRTKATALRIALVADDPGELSEDRLLPLGRAIESVARGLEVSLCDMELVERFAALGVKRLPAFALFKGGRAHLCHSPDVLKELTRCER